MTTLQKGIKYGAVAFAIFLIISIIGGICCAVSTISLLLDKNAIGEMQTYAVDGHAKKLKIDVSGAALEIKSGDGFSVESNHKHLTVKEEDDTLVILESKRFFGMISGGVSVVLTVPEGFVFEEADLSAGAGKVSVDALSTNTLHLDLGAGAAEIGCLNVLSGGEISNGTGKLAIRDGELHDINMDIGVGKLELTGRLAGNCALDYGVGDAELVLLGNKDDYKIKINKGIGDASLEGKAMEDDGVYGGGENQIDIDGGVGTIKIRLKEK